MGYWLCYRYLEIACSKEKSILLPDHKVSLPVNVTNKQETFYFQTKKIKGKAKQITHPASHATVIPYHKHKAFAGSAHLIWLTCCQCGHSNFGPKFNRWRKYQFHLRLTISQTQSVYAESTHLIRLTLSLSTVASVVTLIFVLNSIDDENNSSI